MVSPSVGAVQPASSSCSLNPLKFVLWYGREVQHLFAPISNDQDYAEEVVTRVIKAALLIAIPVATGFVIYGTYQAMGVAVVAAAALFGSTLHQSTPSPKPMQPMPHVLPDMPPPEAFVSPSQPAPISLPVPPPPPFAPSPDLIGRAKSAVDAIDGKLSSIFNNLPELHGQLGKDLAEMLLKFGAEFGPLKGNEECLTIFQQLEHVADLYAKMKNMKQYLFLHMPKISKKGDALEVPPDGSCFFHCAMTWLTLNEQLLRNAGKLQGDLINHAKLRESTIEWMKVNHQQNEGLQLRIIHAVGEYRELTIKDFDRDITFFTAVLSGGLEAEKKLALLNSKLKEEALPKDFDEIDEYLELVKDAKAAKERLPMLLAEKEKFLKKEISFDDYFTLIAQPHFFASAAEVYAFSEMYKVRVYIKEKKDGVVQPESIDAKINFNKFLNAPCLTLIYENDDHFNLSIEE